MPTRRLRRSRGTPAWSSRRSSIGSVFPVFSLRDEESLTAAASALATATGLPIVVDPRAEQAALDAGVVLDLELSNPLSARRILNLLVELAGDEVSWVIRHDTVLITTRERALGPVVLRTHDISPLTVGRTDFRAPRIGRLAGVDAIDEDTFGGAGERVATWDEDDLVSLVSENVAPGSWDEGGTSIQAENGILIVVHTPEVQAQVRRFLLELEAF